MLDYAQKRLENVHAGDRSRQIPSEYPSLLFVYLEGVFSGLEVSLAHL